MGLVVGLLSLLDLLLLVLKDLLIQGVGNLDVGGLPGGKIGGGINNGSLGKKVDEKWLKDLFLKGGILVPQIDNWGL